MLDHVLEVYLSLYISSSVAKVNLDFPNISIETSTSVVSFGAYIDVNYYMPRFREYLTKASWCVCVVVVNMYV